MGFIPPESPLSGPAMNLRLSISLFALFLFTPSAPAAGPFKDPALEALVRAVLHFPTGDLTDEKLKNVHIGREGSGKGIKDLSGLEKCPNIKELILNKNEITELKPLAGMAELQSLQLTNNKIKDVTPLANLKAL